MLVHAFDKTVFKADKIVERDALAAMGVAGQLQVHVRTGCLIRTGLTDRQSPE